MTSYSDQWLGDPLYAPIFDELNRRKTVLYTHPVVAEMTRNVIADVPDTLIEIGTDTTRAIAGVLFSGTAARCPDLRIIWSHAGGTILPVIERFIRLAERPQFAARLPEGILHELTRFYYDVAQVAHPVPMSALREMVPLSQILFGTDYAFRSAVEINEGLARCGLTAPQLRAIRRNLLRSFLTILGIVIGVSAVITMVTLGRGATQAVQAQIASLGTNLLQIRPGQRMGPGGGSGAPSFREADLDAIATQIAGIAAVAPEARSSVTVVAGSRNWSTSVTGTTNAYFRTNKIGRAHV